MEIPQIPEETKNWLLASDVPYVRFKSARLFGNGIKEINWNLDPMVKETIQYLGGWDKEILKQHNKPDLMMHKLSFLAWLGVTIQTRGLKKIISGILRNFSDEGFPLSVVEIPKAFRGSGLPEKVWMLCDFPLILYSLVKMGCDDPRIKKGLDNLEALVHENGYLCLGSNPKFRGPGKKSDICPIANLYAARALSITHGETGGAKKAVEALLNHWELRKEKKFYLFGIGTDFKKLKFPLVWYNLLNMLDVISLYPAYHKHRAFQEMIELLISKADELLRFKPESIYMLYKGRDFANKKEVSSTITMTAWEILNRL